MRLSIWTCCWTCLNFCTYQQSFAGFLFFLPSFFNFLLSPLELSFELTLKYKRGTIEIFPGYTTMYLLFYV